MRNPARLAFATFLILFAGISYYFADNGFLDFASPVFLGGGGGTATVETPFGTLLNPSVSADRERVTLDLSYIALTQITPGPPLLGGHVLNLGLTLPNRAGVFTAIGRFATSSLGASDSGLNWGPFGGFNVSF